MPISAEPFAPKKFATVLRRRMAYIDEGAGDAIVFQHGNPTSSYLWRNVMPHCAGLGRLIACDLIGMGDSDKLPDSGPARYGYAEQREYLFALWDQIGLGERVLPGSIMRKLADDEMAEYRRPFVNPGEDRRPTLTWPRQIPIEGEPQDVVKIVEDYAAWLATSDVAKLFINAEPGSILTGRQ